MSILFNQSLVNKIGGRKMTSRLLLVLLLIVYLVVGFFLKGVLFSKGGLDINFARLFAKYGYEIVFSGAILEAVVLVNFLIPGGSVVLAGAYLASRGIISYPLLLLVAELGFSLGFLLDYLLGYFGLSNVLSRFGFSNSIVLAKSRVKRWGLMAFFISYINHNLASIFATTAGITKMSLKKFIFYNFLADFFWLLFYSGLVYIFGHQIQKLFESNGLVFILIVPILIWLANLLKLI